MGRLPRGILRVAVVSSPVVRLGSKPGWVRRWRSRRRALRPRRRPLRQRRHRHPERQVFFEHSTENWQRVIDVNLTGAFFTLRAASKQIVDQGDGGSLILTSGSTAIQSAPKGQVYARPKAASSR